MKVATTLACTTMLLGTPAVAADVMSPVPHDWSGAYIGVQAGYGWGDTTPALGNNITRDLEYDGFIGGLEAGYQHQSGNLVLGAEIDGSFSDIQGHLNSIVVPCILAPGCDADVDWLGTARARVGYAFDNIMPFVTGGLAFGGVKGTFNSPACTCSVDDTPFGYTLGGGVEWAINDSWSAKAEYLYVNLGKPDIDGDPVFVKVNDYDFSIVRVGFNYNF